ncbi:MULTISPECIES: GTP cyclohydrolase I FolE [unclassified Mucilaginibacter]|uniref:GTP cyclohydrolase I FolE n=1 Tax=unclassified Mucilaginibacter TaxID=2617802 RepID=UPI002AC94B39|nr:MULTISPECIES: GTP cyclohydrolase I FolE [unclassified Mucilaginibacter]MEB0260103.1 GTP cyclohydrolase I FolE [Mucilaginibacter sp. 10I4]MEB0279175.1 GTP cyclohydrolase I FolE [Mucilaginibacter sp. 10B2]MEB0301568.1 GTP cyclohydrolase I FolE [Mucilaginibacter sp. 5C4]WPX22354.1 GTP cyclohydrolase I FolE [Mucilaginibacter sp. 5C4]
MINNDSINNIMVEQVITDLEQEHYSSAFDTPLRPDAFEMDDDTKMELIAKYFTGIMQVLGMDLDDDSLKDTPKRVAKMYVKEIFSGLNPANKPKPTLFNNPFQYKQMLVERNIAVFSNCEHHFVPIVGKAHVAYISNGQVIGLSKLNRIVQYCSQRPQVQERLTMQIANMLKEALGTDDVAVIIDAHHHCVSSRGIRDAGSTTLTAEYCGQFLNAETKNEFLKYIG